MVHVQALGECACDTMVWRYGAAFHLTIAVKATFGLLADGSMPRLAAEPIIRAERHHRDQVTASACAVPDIVPFRPRSDVLLMGHAYAKPGTKTQSCQVRLCLARGHQLLLNKTLAVSGDVVAGEVQSFDKLPILYEHAFGGVGNAENPLGVGTDASDPTPNIRYPGAENKPAGFGPIASSWPMRRKKRGPISPAALTGQMADIPQDFDWSYFQAAPGDQQVDYLHGNETITLDGLHPAVASVQFTLPNSRAVGALFRPERELIAFQADTLVLEPDEGRCSITWRAVVEVATLHELDNVVVVVGVATEGAAVQLPEQRPQVADDDIPLNGTVALRDGNRAAAGNFETTVSLSEAQQLGQTNSPFEIAKARSKPPRPAPSASQKPDYGAPWAGAAKPTVPLPTSDMKSTVAVGDVDELRARVLAVQAARGKAPAAPERVGAASPPAAAAPASASSPWARGREAGPAAAGPPPSGPRVDAPAMAAPPRAVPAPAPPRAVPLAPAPAVPAPTKPLPAQPVAAPAPEAPAPAVQAAAASSPKVEAEVQPEYSGPEWLADPALRAPNRTAPDKPAKPQLPQASNATAKLYASLGTAIKKRKKD